MCKFSLNLHKKNIFLSQTHRFLQIATHMKRNWDAYFFDVHLFIYEWCTKFFLSQCQQNQTNSFFANISQSLTQKFFLWQFQTLWNFFFYLFLSAVFMWVHIHTRSKQLSANHLNSFLGSPKFLVLSSVYKPMIGFRLPLHKTYLCLYNSLNTEYNAKLEWHLINWSQCVFHNLFGDCRGRCVHLRN